MLAGAPTGFAVAVAVGVMLTISSAHPASAQSANLEQRQTSVVGTFAQIAEIEDGRGHHGRPLDQLFVYLRHPNPNVRAASYRAIGRQQVPALVARVYPGLRDRAAIVRLEAISALGQALQGFRGTSTDASRNAVNSVIDSLGLFASRGTTLGDEAGMAARTIGRLPFGDSAAARQGERSIVAIGQQGGGQAARTEGVFHGLYTLARQRRTLGGLTPGAHDLLSAAASRTAPAGEAHARIRRLALLALVATGSVDARVVDRAVADTDEQVRRLAVTAQATLRDASQRRQLLGRALRDRSALVRHEAVRAMRPFASVEGCQSLTEAVGDDNAHVALAAIDGLTAACSDRDRVTETLLGLVDANRSDSPSRAPGRGAWHVHAHALVALAHTAPERALSVVRRDAGSPLWAVRWYVARAARQLNDTATLKQLASDSDGNVRDAAIDGLAAVAGHAGDALYLRALQAPEHHVIMGAALALAGASDRAGATGALLATLDRVTARRHETSRDARIALLERIAELGSPEQASRLESYRSDFDSAVARRAAAVLTSWTGGGVVATPALLTRQSEDLLPLLSGRWRARITMSAATGGGAFEVELFPRDAPYTVARFVRLARSGHYNGRTFHRVEPGFVIQGGSPAANEFVGDGPFMRDELSARSHLRGTLGISTRGRDTGDAQLFVNLTDNFRLDHDYTVFGAIIRGREIAEGVLEGDVIERVEIVHSR